MLEIRFHGRGGQGAVTSVELVAHAAINGGRYAQAFPSFGPERRGAPVLAFLRLNDEPIKIRADIKQPDVVIVLDPSLLRIVKVTAGLKEGGTIIVNTKKSLDEIKQIVGDKYRVAIVDASSIAFKVLGVGITNTTMIGALLRATKVLDLESLNEPIQNRFGIQADKNVKSMREAYEQTRIAEIQNG